MKISVVTTCFNAENLIQGCLESVKGQNYSDVEHVVVDAASTDGTLDILDKYRDGLTWVVSEPDNGIYDGMNKGLQLVTGDVVGFLNADDMYYRPDVLEKVASLFEDPRIDSCYGDLVYIAEGNGGGRGEVRGTGGKDFSPSFEMTGEREQNQFKVVRYWKSGEFDPRKFYRGWMPPHPTFFVRRSVYEKYGFFNLDMGTAADYELMLRFLVKERVSCVYLPEILVLMMTGGVSNVTLKSRLAANRMDRKAWQVNGLKPYPWTLLMKPMRKIVQWFSRPKF